jgi:hypothetical protein
MSMDGKTSTLGKLHRSEMLAPELSYVRKDFASTELNGLVSEQLPSPVGT